MPRKSHRPTLNPIRAWVREGRTAAWVAHQLDVSVRDIEQFKRQNELVSDDAPPEGTMAAEYPDEIDLRAEDDALIAAELEAAELEAADLDAERERVQDEDEPGDDADADTAQASPQRTRRRGGRGR